MTTVEAEETTGLHGALSAPARSPEIPESADVYGWLVGSWALEIALFKDGQCVERGMKGEVHFGWVLEGRAVQDVWIRPVRSERGPDMEKKYNTYGTTLRVWDPAIQAWRVTWVNPVSGVRNELVGRRVGKDIVQVGTGANGEPIRWNFTDITPDSFRWTGESLLPDGQTWRLEAEFRGTRVR